MTPARLVVAFAALTVLPGCTDAGRPPASEPAPPPPEKVVENPGPRPRWVRDEELQFEGAPGEVRFTLNRRKDEKPLALRVRASGMPAGSTVTLGGETLTFEERRAELTVDVAAELGRLPVVDAFLDEADLGLEVVVKLAGLPEIRTQLPKQNVARALGAAFARVEDGGVVFPGEPPAAGPARSAVTFGVGETFRRPRALGSAKTVNAIDWVVIEDHVPSGRSRECSDFGKRAPVPVDLLDSELRIFDRRTGKLIKTGKVPAEDKCPSYISRRDERGEVKADDEAVDRWIRAELAAAT